MSTNSPTDIQKCTIFLHGRKYQIFNVYSPPTSTCSIDDLQDTIYRNTILAGDFNGHSPLWGYADTNGTGKFIEELCATSNLSVLQDENSPPTCYIEHTTLSVGLTSPSCQQIWKQTATYRYYLT